MRARADPSPLCEAVESELLEPIRDVSHAIKTRLTPFVVGEGLMPATFWALHHLDRGASRHPSELARRLGVTPAACTAAIDSLVELGFVERRHSEKDRRQVVLGVTPRGRRVLESVWRRFDTSLREALSRVPSTDLTATVRTMRTLTAQLNEQTERAAAEARA